MKKIVVIAMLVVALTGCGSVYNEINHLSAANRMGNYRVTLYNANGGVIRVWELRSSYVSTESQSDGWYFFVDGRKLVRIAGTVVIEEL